MCVFSQLDNERKVTQTKQVKKMNETLNTINSLRTIHGNFSERDVPDDDLETILDASVKAANSSARQAYSIVVVKERDQIKNLCGFSGSRALIYCADYNRLLTVANHLDQPFNADGVVPFITAGIDAMLAAQTAAIAAKSLGIDSLFTNGIHRGDINRVYEILNLPRKNCFPMIALLLGYPDREPDHQKGRYRGPGLVHYGRYQSMSKEQLDDLVQYYDEPANNMWLNDNWKKESFNHYLDWFFSVWTSRTASIGGERKTKSQMAQLLEESSFADT